MGKFDYPDVVLGKRIPRIEKGDTIVSYTQFSMYQKCPRSWQLGYGMKLRKKEPNIHLLYGTAMHETFQAWITMHFDDPSKAKGFDFASCLVDQLKSEFDRMVKSFGESFSSPEEIMEYYLDGVRLLKLAADLYDFEIAKYHRLLGVELPLINAPDPKKPTLKFMGYIDEGIDRKNYILIEDYKTSNKGWARWKRKDKSTISQILLYKHFFSLIYEIPLDKIYGQFRIFARHGVPQIDTYCPDQNEEDVKKVYDSFMEFLDLAFGSDGKYNPDSKYPAVKGKDGWNCKYCDFKNDEDLCPAAQRKVSIPK